VAAVGEIEGLWIERKKSGTMLPRMACSRDGASLPRKGVVRVDRRGLSRVDPASSAIHNRPTHSLDQASAGRRPFSGYAAPAYGAVLPASVQKDVLY